MYLLSLNMWVMIVHFKFVNLLIDTSYVLFNCTCNLYKKFIILYIIKSYWKTV